ncbi:MAG: serine hydrolase [Anaerolineaceae bacterium]|nr:MAG: serine hydrolase [Anaerolineaceae bacterium]
MEHYNIPGVSIAVINNGELEGVLSEGLRRAGGDSPIKPDTLFQAASISKPVTAMAALRLVEDGKLELDQDVNEVLQSWKIPESVLTFDERVTLRRLLSHTAGMTVHGFNGYPIGEGIPTLLEILDSKPPANSEPIRVELVPGSRYEYSGGGYVVVQQLLNDITSMDFQNLMAELVFGPLSMQNSTFLQPLPNEESSRAAEGHSLSGEPIIGGWYVYPELAAAGLWSTPSDLACFLIEVMKSMKGQSNVILSPTMIQEMLQAQGGDGTWGFGMGFLRAGEGSALQIIIGGSNQGYRSKMVAFPETGQGAVVMANGEAGEELNNEVLRGIAKAYGWPAMGPIEKTLIDVDPQILDQFVGDYILPDYPDFPINIRAEKNKLILNTKADGETRELHPESDTRFFSTVSTREYTFIRDDQGIVVALETSGGGGQTIIVQKVK